MQDLLRFENLGGKRAVRNASPRANPSDYDSFSTSIGRFVRPSE